MVMENQVVNVMPANPPQQPQPPQIQDGNNGASDINSAHSPQSVGREFVRQYYTLLNQAPLNLHRFYSSDSSFVHGGMETETSEPVKGQQAIHQKIMQLNFRDCHAKIRQFDAHPTLGNGVVVQVSGELSNNGQEMRKFMQTFVLAPQAPKKYYVMNDIFRYQDEVFGQQQRLGNQQPQGQNQAFAAPSNNLNSSSDESGSVSLQLETSDTDNVSGHSNANTSEISIESGGSIQISNGSLNASIDNGQERQQQDQQQSSGIVHKIPDVMPANVGPGGGASPVTVSIKEGSVVSGKATNAEQTNADDEQPKEEPQEKSAEKESRDNSGEKVSKHDQDQSSEVVKKDNENAPTPPKEPLSYANRVKSGNSGTTLGPSGATFAPPSGSIKVSGGPPPMSGAKVEKEKYRGNGSSRGSQSGGTRSGAASRNEGRFRGQSEGGDDVQDRKRVGPQNSNPYPGTAGAGAGFNNSNSGAHGIYPDSLQLFVGNLPHYCTEGQLEELFSQFGKVAEIRISSKGAAQSKTMPSGARVPNFGFVVFENESSVADCLRKKPIFLPPNEHRLNVEEKKNKHQIRSENSGNFNPRGSSFERGSQEQLGSSSGGQGQGGRGGRGGGNANRPSGSGGGRNSQQGNNPNKGASANSSFRKKPPI